MWSRGLGADCWLLGLVADCCAGGWGLGLGAGKSAGCWVPGKSRFDPIFPAGQLGNWEIGVRPRFPPLAAESC